MNALSTICQIDYTVIYTSDLASMRRFYGVTLGFTLLRELSPRWIEYQVGPNILALTTRGGRFDDRPPPAGALCLQLAFRVAAKMVDACAEELSAAGVQLISPPTDQPFGHRTVFFHDPDGNVLEIYAEI